MCTQKLAVDDSRIPFAAGASGKTAPVQPAGGNSSALNVFDAREPPIKAPMCVDQSCNWRAAEWEECPETTLEELLAVRVALNILQDHDALDWFRESLRHVYTCLHWKMLGESVPMMDERVVLIVP